MCCFLLCRPFTCEPLSCQPITYTKERYRHLGNLDLVDFSRVGDELQIDALIGSDHFWQLVYREDDTGESGPTAIETHLGWALSGASSTTEQNRPARLSTSHVMHISTTHLSDSPPHLSNLLKAFWDLESLGIKQEEPSVYCNFKKTFMFKNGHYEVNLPLSQPRQGYQAIEPFLDGDLMDYSRDYVIILRCYRSTTLSCRSSCNKASLRKLTRPSRPQVELYTTSLTMQSLGRTNKLQN